MYISDNKDLQPKTKRPLHDDRRNTSLGGCNKFEPGLNNSLNIESRITRITRRNEEYSYNL